MKIIPIYFTFDSYYVLAAGVAFYTLLKHASRDYRYELYVLHTGLTEREQRRLQKVVNRFPDAALHFMDVSMIDTGWDNLRHKAHFSKEIFYKLTAAELFPQYDRILFSDVDVIFNADISSSYFMFSGEHFYFAGTRPILENRNLPGYRPDFSEAEIRLINDYEISAGYMLINLDCIRRNGMQEKMVKFFHDNINRLRLPEQDCIALCCQPDIKFMDYKYGVSNNFYVMDPSRLVFNTNNPLLADTTQGRKIFEAMLADAVQLHYLGADKPWNNFTVPQYKEWRKTCKEASLLCYYYEMQPAFVLQRLKRYSLKRFIGKVISRLKGK